MRLLKILVITGLIYVGIVATFESLLGYFQPADAQTMVITTYDSQGQGADRVVARLESNGALYVAANHWPRAWFNDALENDEVDITFGGETQPYRAVLLEGVDHDAVNAQHALPLAFRILTGFPPRYLMRLDPR
ncbi:MAG: hypothetical protein GWP45_06035 [Proteobacteria bacterium]|jgi:hypothetical protein|nr:hypothetical protein [Pseudomonadota bacterium]